jgi:LPS export ABC transporter protein LptC
MKSSMDRRGSDWKRITLLAGVGGVIIMALYTTLYWDSNPPTSLLNGNSDKNRIDLFAEQVHGIKFDSAGKLVETLRAQRLDHYPARGESVLAEPVLEAQSKDGKIWKITAVTGTLVGDDEIRLQDNVVIIDRTQTFRFESEQLNYFSNKQEAATDVAVKLQRLADVTTAVGMRADLNINRIKLLHKVDSHYVQRP